MSDLISRSKLIEEIKSLSIVLNGKQIFSNDAKDTVLRIINEQPTAYSVDKVVGELKQQAEQYRHRAFEVEKKGLCALADTYYGKQCSYEHAIEIVKQGGVSDDVCEWKKSKDYPFDWLVGCDGCEVNHKQGDYCPRCGKKIKVVE